jgi:hypothetical protein
VKPIETKWKGYRFRSRTEARWAVFFDALELKFEYEPEGIVLPSGPYLPDFRFSTFDQIKLWEDDNPDFNRNYWLEVKGQSPTDDEKRKCWELACASHELVFLAVGAPDSTPQLLLFRDTEDYPYHQFRQREDGLGYFSSCSQRGGLCLSFPSAKPVVDPETGEQFPPNRQGWLGHIHEADSYPSTDGHWRPVISQAFQKAYDASRSARFEFGETDKRWP